MRSFVRVLGSSQPVYLTASEYIVIFLLTEGIVYREERKYDYFLLLFSERKTS